MKQFISKPFKFAKINLSQLDKLHCYAKGFVYNYDNKKIERYEMSGYKNSHLKSSWIKPAIVMIQAMPKIKKSPAV